VNVKELIKRLELEPHPEGGYFKEVYRSPEKIEQLALPDRFKGSRNFATSIYFLIEKSNFSALHKIKSDETWHFYEGDPLEVIEIDEAGKLTQTYIGRNIDQGEVFQYTVKANTWFGSRVKEGGEFSLLGCTVAPGFDFADFEMGDRTELINKFSNHKILIEEMTR
jgi:uncharacterized protein